MSQLRDKQFEPYIFNNYYKNPRILQDTSTMELKVVRMTGFTLTAALMVESSSTAPCCGMEVYGLGNTVN